MNRFLQRIARQFKKRGQKSSRKQTVKPFKRSQAGGWAELDRQNTIPYLTHSQGAR